MVRRSRDQRQLDLAGHLVCAVSLSLQQRGVQPEKARPPSAAHVVEPPVVPAHRSSSSACRSDVSTCPPLLKRGMSSGTAVRLGQPHILSRASVDLVSQCTRPAAIAAGSSLNGRATSAGAAIISTAQRRSTADLKGLKAYCNPARRLSSVESSSPEEQGPEQEGTHTHQQLLRRQLGRTADDSDESLKQPHHIAVSNNSTYTKYQVYIAVSAAVNRKIHQQHDNMTVAKYARTGQLQQQ